jgi:hypothetical protein
MAIKEVLHRVSAALDIAEIRYMLVGSVASSYYGYFRSTADIDIVIEAEPQQLQKLIQELKENDYYAQIDDALEARRNRSMFNVLDNSEGWKIDFIFLKPRPYSREEFRRRKHSIFEGISLFFASPEDTILSKLEWAKIGESARQIEDVARLLIKTTHSIDRAYIDNWAKELGVTAQWNTARQQAGLE